MNWNIPKLIVLGFNLQIMNIKYADLYSTQYTNISIQCSTSFWFCYPGESLKNKNSIKLNWPAIGNFPRNFLTSSIFVQLLVSWGQAKWWPTKTASCVVVVILSLVMSVVMCVTVLIISNTTRYITHSILTILCSLYVS